MKITVNVNLDLWVARDRYGNVFMFESKPKRHFSTDFWISDEDTEDIYVNSLIRLFPDIENHFDFTLLRWEDEPKQLKDIVKEKINNEN